MGMPDAPRNPVQRQRAARRHRLVRNPQPHENRPPVVNPGRDARQDSENNFDELKNQ
jgi:hypothetical protein